MYDMIRCCDTILCYDTTGLLVLKSMSFFDHVLNEIWG